MTLRLIASGDPLRRVSAFSDSLQERYRRTFATPSTMRTYLIQLHRLNFVHITCMYDPAVLRLLEATYRDFPFTLMPIVPNMDRYARLLQNYGLIGSGLRLLRELSALRYPALGIGGLSLLSGLTRPSFITMAFLLAHFDLLQFQRFRPALALLHPTITDTLLANNQSETLRHLVRLVRKHSGVDLGLMTENLGLLLAMIDEQGLDVNAVAGPLSRGGYRVKPSVEGCAAQVSRARSSVFATRISLEAVPHWKDLRFVQAAGASGAVVELPDAEAAWRLLETTRSLLTSRGPGGETP